MWYTEYQSVRAAHQGPGYFASGCQNARYVATRSNFSKLANRVVERQDQTDTPQDQTWQRNHDYEQSHIAA
jgi:hypothetical protein